MYEALTLPDCPSLSPRKIYPYPLPVDASQEAAIRAVKAGQSLVVQGPPGTGKSQLIANLMADAAASGKRVLLVCQKRAALDVVQERLRQVGMAPFLALIHDFQDDRRALYAQIAGQINQVDGYRQQNNSLNAVLLERDFDVESRRIDEIIAELQAFKKALFDTSICGLSAKELYLTSESETTELLLEDVYQQFHLLTVDDFINRLTDYAAYQQRVGADHIWAKRVSFAAFTYADLTAVEQTIVRWVERRNSSQQQAVTLIGHPLSLDQLTDWQNHDWAVTSVLALLETDSSGFLWATVNYLRHNPAHSSLAISESRLEQLANAWINTLTAPGPEESLPVSELRSFRDLLTNALEHRSSWARWNWWQLTNSGKKQLQEVAAVNNLSLSENDLQTLATKVSQRIQLEAIRYEMQPLLTDLSLPEAPESMRLLRLAKQILERVNDLPVLSQLPASLWSAQATFVSSVTTLLQEASW